MASHFRRSEFACPHCGVALARPALINCLENLRHIIGDRPIVIVSGYRCPVHNEAVHGAPDSQHMYGAAADIPARLASLEQARQAGFSGVGTKGTSAVHVDVRDGSFTTWTY